MQAWALVHRTSSSASCRLGPQTLVESVAFACNPAVSLVGIVHANYSGFRPSLGVQLDLIAMGCKLSDACKLQSKVLLLMWSSPVQPRFDVVDLFSGHGEISKRYRAADSTSVEYDFIHGNSMNFLSAGGFAPPFWNMPSYTCWH